MAHHVRTVLRPPRLSSFAHERAQLASSSRSLLFASDGRRLFRAWGPPARPFVVAVAPAGRDWVVEGWGVSAEGARSAVRELFSLDHDLGEFYRQVRREPVLRGTERRFRGLRLPRDPHLFESLLHAVLGQQLSVAAANAIKQRLLGRYGRLLPADGTRVPTFPTPETLERAGTPRLRELGLSRTKARALVELSRWVRSEGSGTWTSELPLADALERLERLHGVGRWTAENALLRAVGRTDIFVAGDLVVRVALERYGAVRRSAPEAQARAWAERYYPGWGSYATLYLWRRLASENAALGG